MEVVTDDRDVSGSSALERSKVDGDSVINFRGCNFEIVYSEISTLRGATARQGDDQGDSLVSSVRVVLAVRGGDNASQELPD